MMEEIIKKLLDMLSNKTMSFKDRREQKDSALRAISNALNETVLYYRNLGLGGKRNLEKEELLVKCWSAAAIPIRHFDPELAVICDQKSEYWIDPTSYSNEEIKMLGIELCSVRKAYHNQLYPHKRFVMSNICKFKKS